jgi:hypothetical protein
MEFSVVWWAALCELGDARVANTIVELASGLLRKSRQRIALLRKWFDANPQLQASLTPLIGSFTSGHGTAKTRYGNLKHLRQLS